MAPGPRGRTLFCGIKGGFSGMGGCCSGRNGVNGAVALTAGTDDSAGAADGIEVPGTGCCCL
jgi:hypothetical protein